MASQSSIRLQARVHSLHPVEAAPLFCRLSTSTARSLLAPAVVPPATFTHDWIASSICQETEAIEFLPLSITFRTLQNVERTVYASYNGGALVHDPQDGETRDSDCGIIEVHPSIFWSGEYTPLHASIVPKLVHVRALPNVSNARQVEMEPLTPADWELLEMHSSFLEDGGLLKQITIVYPQQILPLRVDGRDVAHVRVINATVDNESNKHSCWRLAANTEILIAPKLRQTSKEEESSSFPPSVPLRVHPTLDDFTPDMQEWDVMDHTERRLSNVHVEEASCPPSPLPLCAHLHPDTLTQCVPGWEEQSGNSIAVLWKSTDDILMSSLYKKSATTSGVPLNLNNNDNTEEKEAESSIPYCTVQIVSDKSIRLGHIVMCPTERYQIKAIPLYDKVQLRLLTQKQIEGSIRRIKSMVDDGTCCLNLHYMNNVVDNHDRNEGRNDWKSWRFPSGSKLDGSFGKFKMSETSRSIQRTSKRAKSLKSMVSSWIDSFNGNHHTLPLSIGSMIQLSCIDFDRTEESTERAWYRLDLHSNKPHAFDVESSPKSTLSHSDPSSSSISKPLFIFASDLPALLVRSDVAEEALATRDINDKKKERSKKNMRLYSPSKHDFMLNLLPSTRCSLPIIADTFRDIAFRISQNTFTAQGTNGIIITGEQGSGKTHMALAISASLRRDYACATVYLDCKTLQSSPNIKMADILEELSTVIQEAASCQPSLLVLDDLDALLPNTDEAGNDVDGSVHHQQQSNPALVSQVKMISDYLKSLLLDITNHDGSQLEAINSRSASNINTTFLPRGVSLVCTCRDRDSLTSHIQAAGLFSTFVEVPSLNEIHRQQVFLALFQNLLNLGHERNRVQGPVWSDIEMSILSKKTKGFRPRDLQIVANRAHHIALIDSLGRSSAGDDMVNSVDKILSSYTAISHQSIDLTCNTLSVGWNSIGGLFDAKEILTETILHPVKYSLLYKRSPISLPRGLLLFGPSGCGKTLAIPALARECSFNLVTCRGPELLDKYIGASEAKVRQLFARAYMASPAILFLDEFDALAPRRGSDNTGVTDRVVNQLLTFLDGVEGAESKGNIYIIAATSRPDKIDPALLRPGRLEKHVFIGYPQDDAERNDIFCKIAQPRNIDDEVRSLIESGSAYEQLRSRSGDHLDLFSAADMKAAMDTAQLEAVHELLSKVNNLHEGGNESKSKSPVMITKTHLVHAFKSTRPSMSTKDRIMLENIYRPFLKGQTKSHTTSSECTVVGGNSTNEQIKASDPQLKTSLG